MNDCQHLGDIKIAESCLVQEFAFFALPTSVQDRIHKIDGRINCGCEGQGDRDCDQPKKFSGSSPTRAHTQYSSDEEELPK